MQALRLIKILSAMVGLGLTIIPSILFLSNAIEIESVRQLMAIGMFAWIVSVAISNLSATSESQR